MLTSAAHCFRISLVFLLALFGAFCKPRQLYAGSHCHNFDEASGTCRLVTDCSLAIEAIKEYGNHNFKRCGFQNFTEIVCCPNTELRNVKYPDENQTESRQTDGSNRKCQKACQEFSKDLPIILNYHIVGGEDASLGEFPHMAALGFYIKDEQTYSFDCGGTLISKNYVVTAAHCIINVQENELKIVRLGVVQVPNRSIDEPDPKVDYQVAKINVHEQYNWKEKVNDIALVKLKRTVKFTDAIRPACLYTEKDDPERLMVTGWGTVGLGEGKSVILQKATLSPVSLADCNNTYLSRTNKAVTRKQLCAADETSDACQGDSGGPLQTQSNTSSVLSIVGITSYGIGCGSKYPGIYTRISSYLDWIEGFVWP